MAIGVLSLRGYTDEDELLPFSLAAGITKDDEGKAVTLDTSAPNQVKLAGDGDVVIGRLEVVEIRSVEGVNVGTVALEFSDTLPFAAGTVFAVGDTAVGAGAGNVKPRRNAGDTANEPDWNANFVVEVLTDSVVVVKK